MPLQILFLSFTFHNFLAANLLSRDCTSLFFAKSVEIKCSCDLAIKIRDAQKFLHEARSVTYATRDTLRVT